MANPASPDPILPLPKPPGHQQRLVKDAHSSHPPSNHAPSNPARRVSFSEATEATSKHQHARRSGPPPPPPRKRSCCLTCCICCAWTFLVVLLLLLLLVLTGTLFYMWAQPESPKFQIERLAFSHFNLSRKSDDLTYITTRIDLFLSAANRNDKIGFRYGPTKVFLSTAKDTNVDIGRATIPAFEQGPNNLTIVKVRAGVTDSLVPSADGQKLMESFRNNRVLLNAALKGSVRMTVGTWQSESVDIRVDCNNIDTSKNASGMDPQCEIILLGW